MPAISDQDINAVLAEESRVSLVSYWKQLLAAWTVKAFVCGDVMSFTVFSVEASVTESQNCYLSVFTFISADIKHSKDYD